MNKAELIEIVSKQTGITKKQATDAVETLFKAITQTLQQGNKVQLVGFGRFTVTNRIPRKTKIPGTDKMVDIPAHKTVKFTAGKSLRSALN
jgi:DNA-binding protein HU-beta